MHVEITANATSGFSVNKSIRVSSSISRFTLSSTKMREQSIRF